MEYGAIFTFAPPLPAMMVIGQSQSLPRTAQGLGHAAEAKWPAGSLPHIRGGAPR